MAIKVIRLERWLMAESQYAFTYFHTLFSQNKNKTIKCVI